MTFFDMSLFDRVAQGLGAYPAIVELISGLVIVHQPDGHHDAVVSEVMVALQQSCPDLLVVPRAEVFVETSILRPDLVAVHRDVLDPQLSDPAWFPEPLGYAIDDVVHIVEIVSPETGLIDTLAKLDLVEHGPASYSVVETEGFHYAARTLYGADPFGSADANGRAPKADTPGPSPSGNGRVVQWRPRPVADDDSDDPPGK